MSQVCAKQGCEREATEAFDVGSWRQGKRPENTRHYEVCGLHVHWFLPPFDRSRARAVEQIMEAS